jgi:hypothetical protein
MWWVARAMPLLGNADPGETSDTSILLILVALAVLGGTAILAMIPIIGARKRGGRLASGVAFAGVVWGFATVGLGVGLLFGYAKWSRENSVLMLSGYYDASTAPVFAWHWGWWGVLAAVYVVLLASTFAGRRRF